MGAQPHAQHVACGLQTLLRVCLSRLVVAALQVDTRENGTQWGTGGMATKLTAARIATAAGCRMVSVQAPTLVAVAAGESVGLAPARASSGPLCVSACVHMLPVERPCHPPWATAGDHPLCPPGKDPPDHRWRSDRHGLPPGDQPSEVSQSGRDEGEGVWPDPGDTRWRAGWPASGRQAGRH